MNTSNLRLFKQAAEQLLEENILPYWLALRDDLHGGFYGRVTGEEQVIKDAPRGAILYARILWSFSAAYRVLPNPKYLSAARHAKQYIEAYLLDRDYGGSFWSVTANGEPLDTHKQIYAQAFMLYAFSEYYRSTMDAEALHAAVSLFHVIEQHGRDRVYGGYTEAAARNWQPIEDMRLSDKDENTAKSQNTNLHVLEAYTHLYRIWQTPELHEALTALVDTFHTHIIQPSGHLGLFFNEQWHPTNHHFSAGHDIECSWLLDEAAGVLGMNCDEDVRRLARAASEDLHHDGSIGEKVWWEQAEAVVGYTNMYLRFGDPADMDKALAVWRFINTCLIDTENGEWYWSVLPDGTPDRTNDKAGFWKCPYHNSRMCLEILQRI